MKWIEQYNVDEEFYQYISKDKNYLACLMVPHKGTNWKYMIRINRFETFDRWSVAEIEEFFDTEQEALEFLNNYSYE